MSRAPTNTHQPSKPPRAAAVAGIVFGVLCIVSLALVRLAIPADPNEPGAWLATPAMRRWVLLALHLVPFSGIAFLWFIGVLRNRLGALEDQFFSTVMFGSGLLWLAMIFGAAAVSGGLLETFASDASALPQNETWAFGRATSYALMNIFAIKMAGVFMISTSTIGLRTGFIPRWADFVGIALALVLLLTITDFPWIAMLFPLWVLIVSTYVLVSDLRERPQAAANDLESPPGDRPPPAR
jgi:hypothetical protein